MDPKILENIDQQSKRLIDQLNELEELKDDLEPQEYKELKEETLEQLKTFQKKLTEIQSGDLSLQSKIQKQQEALRTAVKKSFNSEEIKKMMSSSQVQGIRDNITKLNQAHNVSKVDTNIYIQNALNLINQLQDLGVELTPEESQFLASHTGKQNFVAQQGGVDGYKLLQSAEQQLQSIKKI